MRKLSFTGSTEVGKLLMAQCAPTIKKLSLELGGNAPFIVFDDADLDAAVEGAIASKYRNAGQTCVCANRFYVQDGVYDAFADKLARSARQLQVGDGIESGRDAGPLIDDAALAKVEEHIADAVAQGRAASLTGGKRHALRRHVLRADRAGRRHGRRCGRPRGDVRAGRAALPLQRRSRGDRAWPTTPSSASPRTSTAATSARIWRVAEALEYGIVGINTGLISNEVAPFGGVKQSGLGREGSSHGIEEYLEIKYVCLGGF